MWRNVSFMLYRLLQFSQQQTIVVFSCSFLFSWGIGFRLVPPPLTTTTPYLWKGETASMFTHMVKKLCNTIFCVSLGYFNLLYFFFGKNRATLNETLSKRIKCYELIKLSLLLRYDSLSYLYNKEIHHVFQKIMC